MITIYNLTSPRSGVSVLARLLADNPPAHVLEPHYIAVGSSGLNRWLSQELATKLGAQDNLTNGISANISIDFHGQSIRRIMQWMGLTKDATWSHTYLQWAIYSLSSQIFDLLPAKKAKYLAAVLLGEQTSSDDGANANEDKTQIANDSFQIAGLCAAQIIELIQHRPGLIMYWLDPKTKDPFQTQFNTPLTEDQYWQPILCQTLVNSCGWSNPVANLVECIRRLRDTSLTFSKIPNQYTLYGFAEHPTATLSMYGALAARSNVNVLADTLSPSAWTTVMDMLRAEGIDKRFSVDAYGFVNGPVGSEFYSLVENCIDSELIQTFGMSFINSALMHFAFEKLAEVEVGVLPKDSLASASQKPLNNPHVSRETPVLQTLQTSVLENTALKINDKQVEYDTSITFHKSRAKYRQAEGLRDEILKVLNTDPSLEVRDLVIYCPNEATWLPILQAQCNDKNSPWPNLRLTAGTVSRTKINPLFEALQAIFTLLRTYCVKEDVLDLLEVEAIKNRFDLSDYNVRRLRKYLGNTNVKWGLTQADAERYNLLIESKHTFQYAMEQLVLGHAGSPDDYHDLDIVPALTQDGDVEIIGTFFEFIDRLQEINQLVLQPHVLVGTEDSWVAITRKILFYFTLLPQDPDGHTERIFSALDQIEEDVCALIGTSGVNRELPNQTFLAFLSSHLEGMQKASRFQTGDLLLTSLSNVRGIPYRHAFFIGFDEGTFPYTSAIPSDDLIRQFPQFGDTDSSRSDRLLFLEALMNTSDSLHFFWQGYESKSGASLDPALPIFELQTLLTKASPREKGFTEEHTRRYSVHGWEPMNRKVESFDDSLIKAAEAIQDPNKKVAWVFEPDRPFEGQEIKKIEDGEVISVKDFVNFFVNPMEAYVKQTLGIGYIPEEKQSDEWKSKYAPDWIVPYKNSGFNEWAYVNALIESKDLSEENQKKILERCIKQGHVSDLSKNPSPKAYFEKRVKTLKKNLEYISKRANEDGWNIEPSLKQPLTSVPININLGLLDRPNVTIMGSIPNVVRGTRICLEFKAGNIKSKDLIKAALYNLLLQLSEPEERWEYHIVSPKEENETTKNSTYISNLYSLSGIQLQRRFNYACSLYVSGLCNPYVFPIELFPSKRTEISEEDQLSQHKELRWLIPFFGESKNVQWLKSYRNPWPTRDPDPTFKIYEEILDSLAN